MNNNLRLSRLSILALFFLNGTLVSSWVPHIPLIQQKLGLSDGELGGALFSMAIGAVLAMSASAAIIDRFSSKNLTIWSAIAFCIFMPFPVIASSYLTLLITAFLFGSFVGSMDVAMNAQAVIVEKQYDRPIMSSFHGFFSIGGLLGSAIGGLCLAKNIPPAYHVITVSTVLFPALLISFKYLISSKNKKSVTQEKKRFTPNRTLIGLSALAFLVLVAEGSVADWSGVYIKQVIDSGPGFVAAGYAAFSFMMALGRLFGDRFVANIGPVSLTRATSLIAASGLALVLIFPSQFSVIVGFGLVGLGLSNLIPVLFSSAGSIPALSEGRGIAIVATAGYFGFLAGPPIIGVLAEISTLPQALFAVVGAIIFVTIFAGITRPKRVL